jgi:hypothetical protein
MVQERRADDRNPRHSRHLRAHTPPARRTSRQPQRPQIRPLYGRSQEGATEKKAASEAVAGGTEICALCHPGPRRGRKVGHNLSARHDPEEKIFKNRKTIHARRESESLFSSVRLRGCSVRLPGTRECSFICDPWPKCGVALPGRKFHKPETALGDVLQSLKTGIRMRNDKGRDSLDVFLEAPFGQVAFPEA